MPSTFTNNLGIQLPADGEQDGVWGDIVNDNMGIIDRGINGSLALPLSGGSSQLITGEGSTSGVNTYGQYKAIQLTTGTTPTSPHTITILPNDAQKVYFVYNTTAVSVVFTQGSGGNVTIAPGDSGVIYSNGGGGAAAVVNLTDHFAMNSVKITGGTISGIADLGATNISAATGTFSGDLTIADKIVHSGDTNTSVRFPVADTVTVETSGVERTRVHPSGGVSIGNTINPGAGNLSVTGTVFLPADTTEARGIEVGTNRTGDGASLIDLIGDATYTDYGARFIRQDTGPNAETAIYHRGTGVLGLIAQEAAPITFATSNSERMRVTSAGFVGIGTAAPGATLDVNGTANATTLSIGGAAITSTAAELNILDGVTATAAELNILDGVTATTAELNILDGVTATTAELNFVNGVTSAIQTQLDNRVTSNADDTLTGGYTTTAVDDGTPGAGSTYTPSPAGGNMRSITNANAFTLAPPSAAGDYTMVIQITNAGGGGGVVTLSGSWTRTTGSPFTTTATNRFIAYVTKIGTATLLNVVALQ